ncbi:MAG: 50S ribosomal protein L17 [Candidatus Omnitrophota bacterium]
MRHSKKRLQLNRFTSWHDATLKSLARNVLLRQSIKTTLKKAKASKPLIDRLITLGKEDTLFARRQAFQTLGDHRLVSLLFKEIAPRFANRNSGFTRIMGFGYRRGDGSAMAILELTEIKKKEVKKPKKEKEAKTHEEERVQGEEKPSAQKPEAQVAVKEKPPITKKPTKKFLGGLRKIFKKERDSL